VQVSTQLSLERSHVDSKQLYQSPDMKEKIKSLGMELLDFDACSTLWVKDWESWERFSSSPEYAAGKKHRVVCPCCFD
jgi:hypothetical protein